MTETKIFKGTHPEAQPTVSGHVEPVVSRIDDPDYAFFDKGISYSHKDFACENIKPDSCIYLDVEYDEWTGHLGGYQSSELSIMISKGDAIAIAKKFKLTADDLSC